jgi:hypothetical protein
MTNAVVYSIHVDGDLKDSLHIKELKYSIKTLRDYNKDIDINIYISPMFKAEQLKIDSCKVIGFNAEVDPGLPYQKMSRWIDHKWKTAFHALETNDYNSVLMIDPDTIYFNDPEILFKKYNVPEKIYAQQEIWEDMLKAINLSRPQMNDGVVVINKNCIKFKDQIIAQRDSFVLDLIKQYNDIIDHDHIFWKTGIMWSSSQYAVSEYFHDIGNPVEYYDDSVMFGLGLEDIPILKVIENNPKLIILHYTNFLVEHFLPKEYWNNNLFNHMAEEGIFI